MRRVNIDGTAAFPLSEQEADALAEAQPEIRQTLAANIVL
jgi:hypothetical protein